MNIFDIMAFLKSPYAVGAVVVGFLLFWYWFFCYTSQKDSEKPKKKNGYFPGDECPNCPSGSLEKIDKPHTRSCACEAGKPHKLVCSSCKKTFDGFYVPGIQM